MNLVCTARIFNHLSDFANFWLHGCDVLLAAESGVHRHHQHEINQVKHVLYGCGWCCWVERNGCASPKVVDVGEGAVKVRTRLRMNNES